VLSLLLQDPNYQDTEDLIDDVIVLFLAGAKTVQSTTSNIIVTLLEEHDVREKFLGVTEPFMASVIDNLMEKMTLEAVDELDYVKMVYQESMRRDPPLPISGTQEMTRDVTIKGVEFRKGDPFWIMMKYVQNDPKQWREPERFVPERFDPGSEWFLKPDGTRRNPFAFVPFLGGSRVCLGKTFAEVTMRLTLPLYYHYFDFELVEEKHKKKRPYISVGGSESPVVPIKFITKRKVLDTPNLSKL